MEKKNAQSHTNVELSADDTANSTHAPRLTPRQQRSIVALAATEDWLSREAIDRISGASNGPQIVLELRRKFGHDAIEMQRVEATDRDGKACKPGRYRLTEIGRQRVEAAKVHA